MVRPPGRASIPLLPGEFLQSLTRLDAFVATLVHSIPLNRSPGRLFGLFPCFRGFKTADPLLCDPVMMSLELESKHMMWTCGFGDSNVIESWQI